MKWLFLGAACALLSACEEEALAPPAALLDGTYDNRLQYRAADDALKIVPKIGDTRPWIDQQYAIFRRVSVPAISGQVIGLEWRKENIDGEVSRQRLWSFRMNEDPPVMDFYGLKKPIDMRSDAALTALSLDDLIVYGDKCALPVETVDGGYALSIPPTCQITTQSGRKMTLKASIFFDGQSVTYEESGALNDGTPIFEVPGGRPYRFTRR